MNNLEQKHIDTIYETIKQMASHGCAEMSLIRKLFEIQDYLEESRREKQKEKI